MKRQASKTLLAIILIGLFLNSCSKEDISDQTDYTSVSFKLSSESHLYNSAFLEIKELQIQIHENENDPKSWVKFDVLNAGIHDFSQLNEDFELILLENQMVPFSMVYDIKLIFGEDNSIVLNDVLHAIDTPSIHNRQSVNCIDRSLEADKSYEFTMRFELDNSIYINGMDVVLNPKMNTELRTFQLH